MITTKLTYNAGDKYIDLFPTITIDCLKGKQNFYTISEKVVLIPKSKSAFQTITIPSLTESQKRCFFYVELLDKSSEAEQSFSTIDQLEIVGNNLTITRLYNDAETDINVKLTFLESDSQ